MKFKNIATFPVRIAGQMWESAKRPSYKSISDYSLSGGYLGIAAGTIIGIPSGIGVPFYIGWQVGEYVSDKLNLPEVITVAADLLAACGTTSLTASITVPLFITAGAVTLGTVGAVGGTVVGATKKGLEALASKNDNPKKNY